MLYILLAAFNEEKNLPFIFEDIQKLSFAFPYKIILVDDGSSDGTARAAEGRRNVTVISHNTNRGLGKALLTGFTFINKELIPEDMVVVLDADNTHPVELIPTMMSRIREGFDLVIASRFTKGGRQEGLSLFRSTLSKCASMLLRLLRPVKGVTDYSCGYRMYSANLIKSMINGFGEKFIVEKGFSVSLELLLKAGMCTDKITEVPLHLEYSKKLGKSKMKIRETISRYFYLIFNLKRRI